MATSRDWDGPQRCYRTSKLLVEGGGYFVRELVKQKAIHPTCTFNTLDIFLKNKKPTIDMLKQRRIINKSQFNILYPQNAIPTNIDHWDITLASCIVTQCCTLSQAEKRAVDDIRKLRNTLHGHVTTVSMSEQEFQKQWADISNALTKAALLLTSSARRTHISEMIRIIPTEILSPGETIDALKTWFIQANAVETKLDEIADRQASLDTSVRETSDKCDDIKFTLSDIEKYMKDKEAKLKKEQVDQRELNREIEAAKIKLKEHRDHIETNELSTRRTSIGTAKLRSKNIIILTGNPGCGKTFMAFEILKQIVDSDTDIDPLVMNVPKEFKKVLDNSKQLVLFVDDMLGKFSVDTMELNQWNRYVDQFLSFIKTRKLLVIITIRSNIMAQCRNENVGNLFQKDYIYDLDENQLNRKEKEEMLTLYAKMTGVQITKEDLKIAVTEKNYGIGFPFLCTITKGKDIPDLFARPVECIKNELLKMKRHDTASFVALLMTLFCNEKMYRSGLDGHQQHCFEEIDRHFRSSNLDHAKMFDAAAALVKTLLTYDTIGKYFSFVHDTITESTFSAAKESILDILIQFCPLETLTKFVVREQKEMPNRTEEHTQTTANLSYKKLAERFKSEMHSVEDRKAIRFIGETSLWQDTLFCDTAVSILDSHLFYKEDEEQKSLFCYLSRFGNGDLLRRIVDINMSVGLENEMDEHIYKGITEACMFGNADGFEFVNTYLVKISDEMLFAAVHGGNCSILGTLLEKGGNIRARRPETNESLLHDACARNDYGIVSLILERCDEFTRAELISTQNAVDQKTPLLYAAMKSSAKLFKRLLDCQANIDSEDKDGFSSLHCAAMYGNIDVIRYICGHHKQLITRTSTKGYTAAHAATVGDITCLKYVLEQGLNSSDVKHDGGTLLHEASINGNVQIVKYLCEKYHDMMQVLDKDGETASHYAARGGNVDCLATLVEHEVDINIKTNKGYTPLHEAAYCGKIKVVIYLCDTFPEMIRMNDNNNQSAAQHAAAGGHLDCLTYLIEKGINPWIKSNRGFTLLHVASHCGRLGVVKHLCKTYPDMVHMENGYGGSCAYNAVRGDHADCLKYLTEQGIDALERSTEGLSLLHTACFLGRTKVVKYLCNTYSQLLKMTDCKGNTADNHAARGGSVDCLRIVIDFGINPRLTSNGGVPLLHTACRFGQTDVVKYLCKTHTQLLAMTDDNGGTAAYHAARGGHVDCLNVVISNGVDPRSKCKDGTTILHAASLYGHLNEIKYIHKLGMIPVDDRDVYRQTAAYLAAKGGHLDCLEYLLQEKANHAIKTKPGYTLLHVASLNGKVEVVHFLCTQYKDIVGIKSKSGETAAHMSAKYGHLECLDILFEHGLNPYDLESHHMTVLDIAAKNGKVETVKYLCKHHPVLLQKRRLRAINLAKQNCHQELADLIEKI